MTRHVARALALALMIRLAAPKHVEAVSPIVRAADALEPKFRLAAMAAFAVGARWARNAATGADEIAKAVGNALRVAITGLLTEAYLEGIGLGQGELKAAGEYRAAWPDATGFDDHGRDSKFEAGNGEANDSEVAANWREHGGVTYHGTTETDAKRLIEKGFEGDKTAAEKNWRRVFLTTKPELAAAYARVKSRKTGDFPVVLKVTLPPGNNVQGATYEEAFRTEGTVLVHHGGIEAKHVSRHEPLKANGLRTAWPDATGFDDHGRGEPANRIDRAKAEAGVEALADYPNDKMYGYKVNPLRDPKQTDKELHEIRHALEGELLAKGSFESLMKAGTVETVDLALLKTYQAWTRESALEHHLDNPSNYENRPAAIITSHGGRDWVVDGNNRLAVMKLGGATKATVLRIGGAKAEQSRAASEAGDSYEFSREPADWFADPEGELRTAWPDATGFDDHGRGQDHVIVYHGTEAGYLDAIQREGLVPQGGSDFTFVTKDKNIAIAYSKRFRKGAVLEISVPKANLVPDDFAPPEHQVFKHKGTIPPEKLRAAKKAPVAKKISADRQRAAAWAEDRAAELVKGITEETRDRIRFVIARLLDQDVPLTSREARDLIAEAVGDAKRAQLIARTETMLAVHGGRRDVWEQAQEDGTLAKSARRVWVTAEDDLACPICVPLDGKRAKVGGEYPGGVQGPPAHPNCRCTEALQ